MLKFVKIKREEVKKMILKWNEVVQNHLGNGPGLFTEARANCFYSISFNMRQSYLGFIYDIYHLRYLIEKADLEKTKKRLHESQKKRGQNPKQHVPEPIKNHLGDDFNEIATIKSYETSHNQANQISYKGRLPELLLALKDRVSKFRVEEAKLLNEFETNAGHMVTQQTHKKGRKWSIMLEDGADQVTKLKTEDILMGKVQSKFTFNLEDNALLAIGLMLTENWSPLRKQHKKPGEDSPRLAKHRTIEAVQESQSQKQPGPKGLKPAAGQKPYQDTQQQSGMKSSAGLDKQALKAVNTNKK
jgi:hypothetical protein